HEIVEELGQLRLALFVVAAAERVEHLRRELPALHERVENGLLERLERTIALIAGIPAVVRLVVAAGEARLQQKVRKLVEQRLKVDRVGQLGTVLTVRMEAHGVLLLEEYPVARFPSPERSYSARSALAGSTRAAPKPGTRLPTSARRLSRLAAS